MDFNIIIIPIVIIATAVLSSRYMKAEGKQWYRQLRKPSWAPTGKLVREIWVFIFTVAGLSTLWYWNVVVVYWMHYIVSAVLLVNAYYLVSWSKVFFIERNLEKSFKQTKIILATAVLATILIAIDSPIAAGIMSPYIIWLIFVYKIDKEILKMNSNQVQ